MFIWMQKSIELHLPHYENPQLSSHCSKGLKRHMFNVHNDSKKYSCPTCNKKFFEETNLSLHVSTNCGNFGKENTCSTCHEVFGSRASILEHIFSTHKEIKVYKCMVCGHISMKKRDLKYHVDNVHETSNVCHVCAKVFKGNKILEC